MSKKTKVFIYNLACFAVLFLLFRFIIAKYTGLTGYWIPITSFVVATILAPIFQVVKVQNKEKIFMRWIFLKGVKEIE